jgi:putative membrane protein
MLARNLVLFVIAFHLAAFVLEACLWMQPSVYESVLGRLTAPNALSLRDQALVLRSLFVNQGFYNLFLAGAGISGLVLLKRGELAVGNTLIRYMCLFALGAGLVLAASTRAYVGAVLQAVPPAIVLLIVWRNRALSHAA